MLSRAETPSNFDLLLNNSQSYAEAKVQEVLSADTIIIETSSKKGERIRLAGIKAPAPPKRKIKSTKDFDKYGFPIEEEIDPLETTIDQEALQFAKNLLEGKEVRLEFDAIKKNDKYETIAYVFLKDNMLANAEILRQGFAQLQILPQNKKYNDQLRSAYQEARTEKRGLQGE